MHFHQKCIAPLTSVLRLTRVDMYHAVLYLRISILHSIVSVSYTHLDVYKRQVRNGHHAHIGLDGAEGIVGGLGARVGNGVKKCAFAHVGQTDDS